METTDGQLLEQFVRQNESSAFEEIMRRHHAMVLGICHRILGNPHDAQDAFQATFLALSQKAKTMKTWDNVGGWLYTVALNASCKLKAKVDARAENQLEDVNVLEQPDHDTDRTWAEIRPILDHELARLSEKYRLPIIYCYLEGKTYEETARYLRVPHSTVRIRLERAREMLKDRLTKRGVTVSVGILATLLTERASVTASSALFESTVRVSVSVVGVNAAPNGLVSEPVITLTQETLRNMLTQKIKMAVASAAMALLVSGGLISIYHEFQKHHVMTTSAQSMKHAIPTPVATNNSSLPLVPVPSQSVPTHEPEQEFIIMISGSEVWTIDNKTYNIIRTFVVARKNSRPTFTIKIQGNEQTFLISEARSKSIKEGKPIKEQDVINKMTYKIARYAWEQGYFTKATQSQWNGNNISLNDEIRILINEKTYEETPNGGLSVGNSSSSYGVAISKLTDTFNNTIPLDDKNLQTDDAQIESAKSDGSQKNSGEILISGPETCTIDGHTLYIEKSIVIIGQLATFGKPLFQIFVEFDRETWEKLDPTKSHDKRIQWYKFMDKIAQYALDQGYYTKATQSQWNGKTISIRDTIDISVSYDDDLTGRAGGGGGSVDVSELKMQYK